MEDFDIVLQEQQFAIRQVGRIIPNLKKLGRARWTPSIANSRIDDLKRLTVEIRKRDATLQARSTSEQRKAQEYFSTNTMQDALDESVDVQDQLIEIVNNLTPKTSIDGEQPAIRTDAPQVPTVKLQEVRLPRLELPTFEGDCTKWTPFHDLFTVVVDERKDLKTVQKFQYLRASLKGDALRLVHSLQLTDANYEVAWKILKDTYDVPQQIVGAHYSAILNYPALTRPHVPSIKKMLTTFVEHTGALEVLDANHWSTFLCHLMAEKVDKQTREHWKLSLESEDLPTFDELVAFLRHRCAALDNGPSNPEQKTTTRALYSQQTGRVCSLCNGHHWLQQCPRFKGKPVAARRNIVQKGNCCFNCFRPDHGVKSCTSEMSCQVCQKRHHTLLHVDKVVRTEPETTPEAQTKKECAAEASVQTLISSLSSALLPTAKILVSRDGSQWWCARAVLDSGSETNFITDRLATVLGLEREDCAKRVLGIGSQTLANSRKRVQLSIRSRHTNYQDVVNAIVLTKITGHLPSNPKHQGSRVGIKSSELADPECDRPAPVDVLLGVQTFMNVLKTGKLVDTASGVTALETQFGWVLAGGSSEGESSRALLATETSLEQQLTLFWKLEEIAGTEPLSQEEKIVEEHFKATHSRDSNGRYIIRLPFISPPTRLGASKSQAVMRFYQQERTVGRSVEKHKAYKEFMEDYLEQKHMRPIAEATGGCYLPHHAVIRASSLSTKLRVVFDASAKTTSGLSLNDILGCGPQVQSELFDVVIRFRKHPIGITADIRQMFRQIILHPEDRKYHRIVWRGEASDLLLEFELTTLTYGTTSAPYVSERVLLQLARDEGSAFQRAAAILEEDFYVDDCVTGAEDPEDAKLLQEELIRLLKLGGFTLRKWVSSRHILATSSGDEELFTIKNKQTSALGIGWQPEEDEFVFSPPAMEGNQDTKRKILSVISQIYDPMGLIAPIVIRAKIFMQHLWVSGKGWDDELPLSYLKDWEEIRTELPNLSRLRVPRHVGTERTASEVKLQGFCDASQEAYAAVIYVVCHIKNKEPRARLLCSKTRVAPLKVVTLPRLELCGALLLARLVSRVRKAMAIPFTQVRFWTDSKITLEWIQGPPRKWKTFVANRVAEIQELTRISDWHHVSGKENPADVASRGALTSKLIEDMQWWHGPSWLLDADHTEPNENWSSNRTDELYEEVTALVAQVPGYNQIFRRYSSFTRLLRVTAWIRRIKGPREKQAFLTVKELEEARICLVKLAQEETFATEAEKLRRSKKLPKSLASLALFLDVEGILRVGGRIRFAEGQYDSRHPILLQGRHPLATLIIRREHERLLHAGLTLTMSAIQQKYWIPRLRRLVRTCIHNCMVCFRNKAKASQQMMADLPRERVTATKRAFEKCGVDYAGPVTLRLRHGRGRPITTKGYISLFICFTTRAIHLEIVSDLTSEAFIAALRRFIARRGSPSDIYSDRGTNFVGADRLLRERNQQAAAQLATEGIRWHFIPPSAPHFGGLWEAGVRSMKQHLRRTVGSALLTFEEMSTLITQIEACLNSRPYTPLSDDPCDLKALTPGHFLIGDSLMNLPEGTGELAPVTSLKRWERIQQQLRHFWNRWRKEYLNRLQQRPKWTGPAENLQPGMLVLIKEENQSPGHWPLARITEVHPGKDGLVRTATLRTASGNLCRPIVKLCPLPKATN